MTRRGQFLTPPPRQPNNDKQHLRGSAGKFAPFIAVNTRGSLSFCFLLHETDLTVAVHRSVVSFFWRAELRVHSFLFFAMSGAPMAQEVGRIVLQFVWEFLTTSVLFWTERKAQLAVALVLMPCLLAIYKQLFKNNSVAEVIAKFILKLVHPVSAEQVSGMVSAQRLG